MKYFEYFVTEYSEHFSEYVPCLIKSHRRGLISYFGIPLDEYPRRCEEQITEWFDHVKALESGDHINYQPSHEYAADKTNALIEGEQCTVCGNVVNKGFITQLPDRAAVEVESIGKQSGIETQIVKKYPRAFNCINAYEY